MLKKLKEIGEEFKQSPLRLSASVKELAQVISPSPSASSLESQSTVTAPLPDALSVTSDVFSIGDDPDSANSSRTLHQVDLTASSPVHPAPRSRRSSLSSIASDVSSLFPIYESPLNHSSLQSEYESELEDGTAAQLDKVSKEQLYQGYKKLLYRYNKYKSRFVDLHRLYKDSQYDHVKTKNVLQETQDKSLRRIAELREQCQLEQNAKAHLEESLRNDLEERDHIINTLKTKISLLQHENKDCEVDDLLGPIPKEDSGKSKDILKINEELQLEVDNLRKLLNVPTSVANGPSLDHITTGQVKEKITELKSGIVRMKSDNESISNLLSKSPSSSEFGDDSGVLIDLSSPEYDEKDKRIEKLNKILLKCKEKISSLQMDIRKKNTEIIDVNAALTTSKASIDKLNEQLKEMEKKEEAFKKEVSSLKKREEENVLTIAENKKAIHEELESKELQIKALSKQLLDTNDALSSAQDKLTETEKKYINEVDSLKEKIYAVNKENVDLKNQLDEVQSEASKQSLFSEEFFQQERLRFNTLIEEMVKKQQDKIQSTLENFDRRIAQAKGKLSELCLDNISTRRATEIELRKEIEKLEIQVQDGGVNRVHLLDLEEEVKRLDASLSEKEKVIVKLNEELNEKIDRIVDLGKELEDTNMKLKMHLDSSEAKQVKLVAENLALEEKCKQFWQDSANLRDQTQSLNDEISCLRDKNDELMKTVDDLHLTIASSESSSSFVLKEIEELREVLSLKEEELTKERTEKANLIQSNEDNLLLLTSQVKTLESKVADNNFNETEELKDKLAASFLEIERCKVKISSLEKEKDENANLHAENLKNLDALILENNNLKQCVERKQEQIDATLAKSEEHIRECESLKLLLDERMQEKNSEQEQYKITLRNEIVEKEKLMNECNRLEKCLLDKEIELEALISKSEATLNNTILEFEKKALEANKAKDNLQVNLAEKVALLQSLEKQLVDTLSEKDNSLSKQKELEIELEKKLKANEFIMNELNGRLRLLEDELQITKQNLDEKEVGERNAKELEQKLLLRVSELEKEVDVLTSTINTNTEDKQKYSEACEDVASLLKDKETEVHRLIEEEKILRSRTADFKAEIEALSHELKNVTDKYQKSNSEKEELSNVLKEKEEKIALLDESERKLRLDINESDDKVESLANELNSYKNQLKDLRETINEEKNKMKEDCQSKVNILKNEIDFLRKKFESEVANMESNREREVGELNKRLKHSETTAAELLTKMESVAAERDELQNSFDEKSLKVSELETYLAELKSDLDKNFNDKSKTSALNSENIYEDKLKKILNDFEVEVARRDETIRDLELQVSDLTDTGESVQMLRQEVKKLKKELKEKDNLIEVKLEEHVALKEESENKLLNARIDNGDLLEAERNEHKQAMMRNNLENKEELLKQKSEFEKILANQKADHEQEIERIRNERENSLVNERSKFEGRVQELEKNFKKETTEWLAEKKNNYVESNHVVVGEDDEGVIQELECTSKVAVAAVETSAYSIDLLKKKIMLQAEEMKEMKRHHKREVIELKTIANIRSRKYSEREGEDVEHEYLRNILYEYMMGKEQMVLAKVLAAIVKFDRQQTKNVLDRQSTAGHLRLL